jgi:hypothetical protein
MSVRGSVQGSVRGSVMAASAAAVPFDGFAIKWRYVLQSNHGDGVAIGSTEWNITDSGGRITASSISSDKAPVLGMLTAIEDDLLNFGNFYGWTVGLIPIAVTLTYASPVKPTTFKQAGHTTTTRSINLVDVYYSINGTDFIFSESINVPIGASQAYGSAVNFNAV